MNCGLCKGSMQKKLVTYTEDLGRTIVIIRNVPAMVCEECGNVWYAGMVIAQIEAMVDAVAATPVTEVAIMLYPDQVA